MEYLDYFGVPMADDAIVILALAVGLAGIGVAIAYVIGDPYSPATRALAFAVGVVGVANAAYPAQHVLHPDGDGMWWLVRLPLLDALVMSGLLLWMLQVERATRTSERVRRWIHICSLVFGVVTAFYLLLGALFPTERMTRFLFCMGTELGCTTSSFWMFAAPVTAMGSLLVLVGVLVFSQNVDPAERIRVICVAAATPFFFANYVLPAGYNVMTSLPGLFLFLVGGIRYQTIQGERGQFLSRFLSPAVVREVAVRGLDHTLQPEKLELSVVCCDLRGFTTFSAAHDSAVVMQLIGEYYDAVGAVVARYEATVKDYSGDGVMILVGAPMSFADHAERALAIAREILIDVGDIASRWSEDVTPLDVGLGVATGVVAVGAVGTSTRMEYTAIGTAPNLASRLCDAARPGEALIHTRTAELAGATGLEPRHPVELKGMGVVAHFALLRRSSVDADVTETSPAHDAARS